MAIDPRRSCYCLLTPMTWLYTPLPRLSALVAALALAPACTSDAPGDESDPDGAEEPLACAKPGSALLDSSQVVGEVSPDAQPIRCSAGWASDAPQLDPVWTLEVSSSAQPNFSGTQIGAHPDGGVILAGPGLFARYDSEGEQQWSKPSAILSDNQAVLLVEAAGTILIATFNWNTNNSWITRYAADGATVGAVTVIDGNTAGNVWGLASYGEDLIIGTIDPENSWKTTLIRLDAKGDEVLRKASNLANPGLLAVNGSGTVAFGSFPTFLLSADKGAVLGNLAPNNANAALVVGFGDDFMVTGGTATDLFVGRYAGSGSERWSQTYDRANLNDMGSGLAVGPEGGVVVTGNTTALQLDDAWWFAGQPLVLGLDADGNALWSDRIAAFGNADAVAIGTEGEVYVVGTAQGLSSTQQQAPPLIGWLRCYRP